VTERIPPGFRTQNQEQDSLPDATGSEQWYVWEVRLVDPDGEDHVWVLPSQFIEDDGIRNHLLATDPDFREIVGQFRRMGPDQDIGFRRYPFDKPYQSEGFRDFELAFAVAFTRASQHWEDGLICHGPSL